MVESIAAVTFNVGPATSSPGGQGAGKASVFDVARFEALHQQKTAEPQAASPGQALPQGEGSAGFNSALRALQSLNGRVDGLHRTATEIATAGKNMTPGKMLMLTMRANQFMFYSELTAHVANTSSQGVQQLFRQQG